MFTTVFLLQFLAIKFPDQIIRLVYWFSFLQYEELYLNEWANEWAFGKLEEAY